MFTFSCKEMGMGTEKAGGAFDSHDASILSFDAADGMGHRPADEAALIALLQLASIPGV